MAGMEVPIIGSDSVRWKEVSVPSSTSALSLTAIDASADANVFTASIAPPLTEDFASSSVTGNNPPTYLIWFCLFCFSSLCQRRLRANLRLLFFFLFRFEFNLQPSFSVTILIHFLSLSFLILGRRIHKSQPSALELLELCASKEFPTTGLRITFPDALSPFAFVCKNQVVYLVFLLLLL